MVKEAKWHYGRRLESQLQHGGSRSMWQGLRTITDYKTSSSRMVNADASLADKLDTFNASFKAAANSANGTRNANSATSNMHTKNARAKNTLIFSEHQVKSSQVALIVISTVYS